MENYLKINLRGERRLVDVCERCIEGGERERDGVSGFWPPENTQNMKKINGGVGRISFYLKSGWKSSLSNSNKTVLLLIAQLIIFGSFI